MIILITGASHTGKTLLAQKLLEKYHYPYLSMDHVKMGLIRSGNTALTPYDDDRMIFYLWPIIREIIKTAIENGQNLTVEGCYVPADWEKDFSPEYRDQIKFRCLVMTENYIRSRFDKIKSHASEIEKRGEDTDFDMETAIRENKRFLAVFGNKPERLILIDKEYPFSIECYVFRGTAMSYIKEIRKHIGHAPMLSAGATVVVIEDGKILLNLRSDTNTWGIPGGALELGETLEQTAARELKEETNLSASAFRLLNVFSGPDFYFKYPNGDELYSVVTLFLAEDVSGKLRITDGESFQLRYFGKDELPILESRAAVILEWLIQRGILS